MSAITADTLCTKCGTKWEHIKESGVGGHGSTWSVE